MVGLNGVGKLIWFVVLVGLCLLDGGSVMFDGVLFVDWLVLVMVCCCVFLL